MRHLKWRVVLSDIILKGDHSRTFHPKFGLIWFIGFRGEDFCQLEHTYLGTTAKIIIFFTESFSLLLTVPNMLM